MYIFFYLIVGKVFLFFNFFYVEFINEDQGCGEVYEFSII